MGGVLVLGGGTMGSGIAASLAATGCTVEVVEADANRVAAVRDGIADTVRRMARKQGFDAAEVTARVAVVGSIGDVSGDPELVIEAVPEDLGLKRDVLAAAERRFPQALLASNTSSLSITAIGTALAAPERLCGMHFFNPVPVSALIEVVRGEHTAASTVEAARAWSDRLGKTAIVVDDAPGFASSRLGLALGLEAIRMVESGVASADDIDTAMCLGYRHPIGPLRLTDLVGLDVRLAIAEHLHRELGSRFEPPALLREMVAEGRLGKKTGRGFFDWAL